MSETKRHRPVSGAESGTARRVRQLTLLSSYRTVEGRTGEALRSEDADVDRDLREDACARPGSSSAFVLLEPATGRASELTDVAGDGGWSDAAQVERDEDSGDAARCEGRPSAVEAGEEGGKGTHRCR